MSGDVLSDSGVEAAAELGRAAEAAQAIELDTGDPAIDSSLIIRITRNGECMQVQDLERVLGAPRDARGRASLHDADSFATYVSRLASEATTVWCNDLERSITAVINDHYGSPGWRDHTATLRVQLDEDWKAWTSRDGTLYSQTNFGEFLEDQAHTIADPPAGELLTIATTLTAKRNLTFESSVRLQSGDIAFGYTEETTAKASKGRLEVPERFTLRLPPFRGSEPISIAARLRYRISVEGLRIGYRLQRPDIAEQVAFDAIVTRVGKGIPSTIPVLTGAAPEALR